MSPLIRRGLLALVLVLVLLSLGRSLRRSLASDETRIQWRIDEMLEGFSDGRVRPVLRNVHSDFVDESSGATRDDLHGALLHLYLTEKMPETKAFALGGELVADDLEIVVEEGEPGRADVHIHARFVDRRGDEDDVYWDARAQCEWVMDDGRWKLVRTRGVNHRERR